eukprot:15443378-Alexandrium_andersonii.AAC.1
MQHATNTIAHMLSLPAVACLGGAGRLAVRGWKGGNNFAVCLKVWLPDSLERRVVRCNRARARRVAVRALRLDVGRGKAGLGDDVGRGD